jgi:hypothetical protein
VPCVSPWAYERIHRWNPDAIDPNRSFRADSPAEESAALVQLLAPLRDRFLVHIDLHETTDTDETEFRPALAARDGKPSEPEGIPDGFYLVGDTEDPQPAFQQAIIAAVEQVTHIAPADANGEIIASPVVAHGVINYPSQARPVRGITNARYRTTTEVYPDSPRATPAQCNAAQVAAVRAAIDYALANGGDQRKREVAEQQSDIAIGMCFGHAERRIAVCRTRRHGAVHQQSARAQVDVVATQFQPGRSLLVQVACEPRVLRADADPRGEAVVDVFDLGIGGEVGHAHDGHRAEQGERVRVRFGEGLADARHRRQFDWRRRARDVEQVDGCHGPAQFEQQGQQAEGGIPAPGP